MLASILPWARFRRTYGEAIENARAGPPPRGPAGRPDRRLRRARPSGAAWLLDEGYRGEMECIIAKIFGSESQKEAAIELLMKTHGGRSLSARATSSATTVHEFLAPCIYEGEGEMLGMAFFKSLVKAARQAVLRADRPGPASSACSNRIWPIRPI